MVTRDGELLELVLFVCLFCFLKPQVIMPEKKKCSILFLAYL